MPDRQSELCTSLCLVPKIKKNKNKILNIFFLIFYHLDFETRNKIYQLKDGVELYKADLQISRGLFVKKSWNYSKDIN